MTEIEQLRAEVNELRERMARLEAMVRAIPVLDPADGFGRTLQLQKSCGTELIIQYEPTSGPVGRHRSNSRRG